MKALPTDREILKHIYEMYQVFYPGKSPGKERGENDPYLPIEIPQIASRMGCSAEMLFGRLYYHLDAKYRYTQDNGGNVHMFLIAVGSKRHCVNFPYLVAVLAEKDLDHRRQLWSLGLSIAALALSVGAIIALVLSSK